MNPFDLPGCTLLCKIHIPSPNTPQLIPIYTLAIDKRNGDTTDTREHDHSQIHKRIGI